MSANPSVMVERYTLSPEILMPGDTALLTVYLRNAEAAGTETTVTNDGGTTTTTVHTLGAILKSVSISPAYDGSRQLKATASYSDVGVLAPAAGLAVPFKLACDPAMTEGTYFLTVNVDVSTYTDVNFPIAVRVQNTSLSLAAKTSASSFSASGATNVTISVWNPRASAVEAVEVRALPCDGITWDKAQTFVGTLAGGATRDVSFSLHPAASGTVNLSFAATFLNGDNRHSTVLPLSVDLRGAMDVAPVFTSVPTSVPQGKQTRISLEVYNAKADVVSGVIITPVSTTAIFPSQHFIGTMDPDDVFSASFELDTTSLPPGNHSISFVVSYKQGSTTYETPPVTASFTVTAAQVANGDIALLPLAAVVGLPLCGLVVGVYAYRKRRPK